MRHRLCVLLVLLARALVSPEAFAQQPDTVAAPGQLDPSQVSGVVLEQNYPNPFRTDTRIPFILGEELFQDGRAVVVTVRIYNLLRQLVAIPKAVDHPSAAGQPANEISYDRPGRYLLYWDGTSTSGDRVTSGIYFCQIIANGHTAVGRMIVTR